MMNKIKDEIYLKKEKEKEKKRKEKRKNQQKEVSDLN